jgi:hypothetical protein
MNINNENMHISSPSRNGQLEQTHFLRWTRLLSGTFGSEQKIKGANAGVP